MLYNIECWAMKREHDHNVGVAQIGCLSGLVLKQELKWQTKISKIIYRDIPSENKIKRNHLK